MPTAAIISEASFISCELLIRTGARTLSVASRGEVQEWLKVMAK
jgi:hypothetical protein